MQMVNVDVGARVNIKGVLNNASFPCDDDIDSPPFLKCNIKATIWNAVNLTGDLSVGLYNIYFDNFLHQYTKHTVIIIKEWHKYTFYNKQ